MVRGHQLNIVIIEGQAYAVDVGFGSQGPTRPLPVISGAVTKWGATNAEARLTYEEPNTPFIQGRWCLEQRFSDSDGWKQIYTFSMTEFFQKDYEVMSFATSNRKTSWFTQQIVCARMILDEKVEDIIGTITMSNRKLKRRIQGNLVASAEFSSEEERVKSLGDYFGIFLSKGEIAGIKGTAVEVKEVEYFADV
jgi:arylamine N-acetyltransferase